MNESKVDTVRLSREAISIRPSGASASWFPPVLKRFYDFTRKWAKTFNNELKGDHEEELIKAVAKHFKGEI